MPKPDCTGENIKEFVDKLLKDFGIDPYQLLSSTSDSARNCVKVSIIVHSISAESRL